MELNEKHGVIAVAAVVFLIIILSIWFFLSKEPAATATNCPVDEKKYLAGHTYIIVDQTGGFTDNQQRQLRSVIYDFAINKNKLKKYEKLTIIPLAQKKVVVLDSDSMKFNYCRPELGKNKRFSDEEYKNKFMFPLKKVFKELKEAKTSNNTHLFELIHMISNQPDMALKDQYKDNFRRRIIIFSDMLHHNEEFSFYRSFADIRKYIHKKKCTKGEEMFQYCSPNENEKKDFLEKLPYEEAKKKNPDYFDDLIKPRFADDVKVALYILGTDTQASKRWKVVRQFWMDYFKDNKLKFDIEDKRPIPCMAGGENYKDGCIWIEGGG